MEWYFAIERRKISPFVTASVNLENNMLSKLSQTEKDRDHMILLISVI